MQVGAVLLLMRSVVGKSGHGVTRMNIIVSHISWLIVVVMGDGSVHGFHGTRLIIELITYRWLGTSQHDIVVRMLNHRLMPMLSIVTGNSRGLDCADFATDPMATVQHLVKHFLLGGISICLILLTYWHASIAGIIALAEEICSCVVSVVWLRLVRLILILSRHDA